MLLVIFKGYRWYLCCPIIFAIIITSFYEFRPIPLVQTLHRLQAVEASPARSMYGLARTCIFH